MQIATIDFETFWDKDFSLKSKDLNMSEYVRDERFAVHMMAMKIGNGATVVYPPDEIPGALAMVDWTKTALLCHNTAFDGFILSEHYDVVPAFYYDTLSMARGIYTTNFRLDLDSVASYCELKGKIGGVLVQTKGVRDLPPDLYQRLSEYCAQDTETTRAVFDCFMREGYPDAELQLIDLTLRMFCEPVLRVDLARVEREMEREIGKKVAALFAAGVSAEDLMSNQKFAKLLESRGYIPPVKISTRTKKITFAFARTDPGFAAMESVPQIAPLIKARKAIKSTIGETRAGRLLKVGDAALPVMLNYCGAHTTRWSGGNKMNLQNLNRGGELRKSILAPEGYAIVVADSAQIEARVLAWLAQHQVLLDLFRQKADVYKWMASRVYKKDIGAITKDERFIGKVLTLGLGYGMGGPKLQDTLAKGALGADPIRVSLGQAEDWVNTYREDNKPITELWSTMKAFLPRMESGIPFPFPPLEIAKEAIILPSGLALQYPDLRVTEENGDRGYTYQTLKGRSRLYGGLLTENVVQALARCIVADQMLAISKAYRVVTMTHDEIVAVAPLGISKNSPDACLAYMLDVMRTPPEWAPTLPLDAEGGWDTMYSK